MGFRRKNPWEEDEQPLEVTRTPLDTEVTFDDPGAQLDHEEKDKLGEIERAQKRSNLAFFLSGLAGNKVPGAFEQMVEIPDAFDAKRNRVKEYFKQKRLELPNEQLQKSLQDATSQQSKMERLGARMKLSAMLEQAKRMNNPQMVSEIEEAMRGLDSMAGAEIQGLFGGGTAGGGKAKRGMSTLGDVGGDANQWLLDEFEAATKKGLKGSSDGPDEFGLTKSGWKLGDKLIAHRKDFLNRSKDTMERIKAAADLATFLANPNANLASKMISSRMARMSGDKGALSNYDVQRYTTLEGFTNRLKQLTTRFFAGGSGSMTQQERDELWYMMNTLKNKDLEDLSAMKEDYVSSFRAAYGEGVPEEQIAKTLPGYNLFKALASPSLLSYKSHGPKDLAKMQRLTIVPPEREKLLQQAQDMVLAHYEKTKKLVGYDKDGDPVFRGQVIPVEQMVQKLEANQKSYGEVRSQNVKPVSQEKLQAYAAKYTGGDVNKARQILEKKGFKVGP